MGRNARSAVFLLLIATLPVQPARAGVSTLTRAEGHSCLGEEKSKRQVEKEASDDARRKALEQVAVHVQSKSEIQDGTLLRDLVSAYANGTVRVLQELEKGWYRDAGAGDCFRIALSVEVFPDEGKLKQGSPLTEGERDPLGPLTVRIWSQQAKYNSGNKMKLYLKGNKPFYATIVHRDAEGNHLQLLPNPYRHENYFQGNVTYEIPSGQDQFDLSVKPPFGHDTVTLYASTARLGALATSAVGSVYAVQTPSTDIGKRVRGVALTPTNPNLAPTAEFSEADITIETDP